MARKPQPLDAPQRSGISHTVDLVRASIPPLHPAGVPFVAAPLAVAALARKRRWIRRPALLAAAAFAGFFRHPHRVPPARPNVVVAPADGEIALADTALPPAELDLGTEPLPRVSVFLSVLDVHVQRSPVSATVQEIVYRKGEFRSADLADASEVNERSSMLLETDAGQRIAVVQIAGLLARRIVNDAKVGDKLAIGSTYGLIKFGSRVDTYFPAGTKLLVNRGQRAIGGETVFAELP